MEAGDGRKSRGGASRYPEPLRIGRRKIFERAGLRHRTFSPIATIHRAPSRPERENDFDVLHRRYSMRKGIDALQAEGIQERFSTSWRDRGLPGAIRK